MKIILFLMFYIGVAASVHSQKAGGLVAFDVHVPNGDQLVAAHKETLQLTLVIDSVVRFNKTYKLNWRKELTINHETDYLQIANDLYIKIFIARNVEYGKKFYSWRWDYLKKVGEQYLQLGGSEYQRISFNSNDQLTGGSWGQGIGDENSSDYLMFYYRSKIQ